MEREVGYYITYAFLPSFMPKGFDLQILTQSCWVEISKFTQGILKPQKVCGSIMGIILDETIDSSSSGRSWYN